MPIRLPFRPRRDAYPPDLWTKCPSCEEMLFNKQLDKSLRVCTNCGHHFRIGAPARLELLIDAGTFVERDAGLQSKDPLGFVDQKPYPDRVAAAQVATGLRDAMVWGTGRIDGRDAAICVMDFGFMGGSMGAVVGEKVARAAEAALAERLPLIIVSASGGARMQEGTFALMQLVKTVAAIDRLRVAGVPCVSVLTDPTTGGVFASFASIGDVNLAEPDALIGFAGARVQAGTIAQELPPGFQRSEFLFEHGFIDRVVPRAGLKAAISELLGYLVPQPLAAGADVVVAAESEPRSFGPLNDLFAAFVERVGLDADSSPNGTPAGATTGSPAAAGSPARAIAATSPSAKPDGAAPDNGARRGLGLGTGPGAGAGLAARTTAPARSGTNAGDGRLAMPRSPRGSGRTATSSTGTTPDARESATSPAPSPRPAPAPTRPRNG